LAVCRSPTGDFKILFEWLDSILQKVCSNKYNMVICGDINVNYLTNWQTIIGGTN
jgi:hypothetical protein